MNKQQFNKIKEIITQFENEAKHVREHQVSIYSQVDFIGSKIMDLLDILIEDEEPQEILEFPNVWRFFEWADTQEKPLKITQDIRING